MDIHNLTAKERKKIHTWLRALIQLLYFIFIPSVYTAAFAGVKYIFTQIGAGEKVVMTSFVTVLLVICLYTMVFGRFFCGFVCAFGAFGDALYALYTKVCKKWKKKPVKIPEKTVGILGYMKYLVLLLIVLLCYSGVYGKAQGTSPWDVFSMIHAGNFRLGGYGDRSCSPDSSDGWHVCTGKILLQVLLPYGSSIFSASGAAFFRPSQNERKLQKRM